MAGLLFNRSPTALAGNLTWAMLGLPPGTRAAVRDLWAHADQGVFTDVYSALVPPHDVVMIRVTPS